MELATALIWALRIVLPIILFCIYFKLQSPKDDERSFPGPTKNSHPRQRLLAHRKAVEGEPAPDSIKTITLVTQADQPDLFATPNRRGGGGRQPREERGDRRDRGDRGERKERKERSERSERRGESHEVAPPGDEAPAAGETVIAEASNKGNERSLVPPSEEEDKQHLESLLNYVAFNRKEQQRSFIHDGDAPPPPPPPAKPKDAKEAPVFIPPLITAAPPNSGEIAAKANTDAQLVLNGAMKYKRADVAKNLYEQLLSQDVEISEKTFTLMIESCVAASNLKDASDLLMKMESSGHSPDTHLLDKVMDLYSQSKARREQDKAPSTGPVAESGDAADGGTEEKVLAALAELPRTKLSSEANLFTPFGGLGQPPPPPPPPPPTAPKPGSTEAASTKLRPGADPFQAVDASRTALKATSKAFQPSGTVTFNPYEYTWTVDTSKQQELEKAERKGKHKGKGESNGKGAEKYDAGKGKDKWKEDKWKAPKTKEDTKAWPEPKSKEAKAKTTSKWVVKA